MQSTNVVGHLRFLLLAPLAVSVIALSLAGCASTDGAPADGTPAADDITPQELAAGEAAGTAVVDDDGTSAPAPADGARSATPESAEIVTTPAEDALPFLDPESSRYVIRLRRPSASIPTR